MIDVFGLLFFFVVDKFLYRVVVSFVLGFYGDIFNIYIFFKYQGYSLYWFFGELFYFRQVKGQEEGV